PQAAVGAGELVEGPARHLDHHVVEGGLEGGEGAAGDLVADLLQPAANRHLGGDAGDRVAGGLGGQRGRAGNARVDLDHVVRRAVRIERELDVAAALDTQRPDYAQRG